MSFIELIYRLLHISWCVQRIAIQVAFNKNFKKNLPKNVVTLDQKWYQKNLVIQWCYYILLLSLLADITFFHSTDCDSLQNKNKKVIFHIFQHYSEWACVKIWNPWGTLLRDPNIGGSKNEKSLRNPPRGSQHWGNAHTHTHPHRCNFTWKLTVC